MEVKPAKCLHCGNDCKLIRGEDIYRNRPELADIPVWRCKPCNASVGCHKGTQKPLGHAADWKTRTARQKLHKELLDPLWKTTPTIRHKVRRSRVYRFLSAKMGLPSEETHVGMFTIEQCREAWVILNGETPASIKKWLKREGERA